MNNELFNLNISPELRVEFLKSISKAKELMAYYECAIMEVETKFKVLNKQFIKSQQRETIFESFNPQLSKSIVDRIDVELAKY